MSWPWSKRRAPAPVTGDARTVVLVGHCGLDQANLERAVARAAPGARVEAVNADAALADHRHAGALLLVNRVLDGRFAASGPELVAELAADANGPAVMLVSNHEEAQADAVAAGALPGFGKGALRDAATLARLRAAIDG